VKKRAHQNADERDDGLSMRTENLKPLDRSYAYSMLFAMFRNGLALASGRGFKIWQLMAIISDNTLNTLGFSSSRGSLWRLVEN
jgi:hypothetical protein